jgi:hypothetical protein
MEPGGSLPYLQEPATCRYPEPAQSSPWSHPTSWRSILILPSHLRLGLPSICRLFPNMLIFYGEELLAPRPTHKLEDHPLSAVRDCLFNVFAATLHIWRPFSNYNTTATLSCRAETQTGCRRCTRDGHIVSSAERCPLVTDVTSNVLQLCSYKEIHESWRNSRWGPCGTHLFLSFSWHIFPLTFAPLMSLAHRVFVTTDYSGKGCVRLHTQRK